MKIINELSYSQINTNKKDTLATRLSIFLAVVLLGTIIFIIGSVKSAQHHEIVSTVGDYQVSITDVNKKMVENLFANEDIKKVSFDKFISTDLNAVIIEKGSYFKDLKGFEIVHGRNTNSGNELIAPTRFFQKNKDYKIGSKLKVEGKEYILVGEYRDDYESSFEESALIGILDNESKENILNNSDGIEVFIWYKNPRDTYKLTKSFLEDFKIDYTKSLDTGRLYFNKPILEDKMIYPSGIIPPKSVMAEWVETYGACMVLVILFAVMIYGAFNVWNNRDVKELALLKSVGMTEKQVKKMIRLKAIKIGVIPVLAGTIVSYLTANILFYFMWLNNLISYKKLSDIFGEKMRATEFHLVSFSFSTLFLILVLAFITVYLSAIMPARKSAKLNVIEGLTGIANAKVKYGKSKISGKVEKTLAKDYFRAYSSTYKTIILAMLLSAMVMTLVLVSQSYRTVDETYGIHKEQYNFQSQIFTDVQINKQMLSELYQLDGIDEIHAYENKSFKFYLSDNKEFNSDELNNAV
ncbi:TPA: FtsX-like permease family protein, partial [Streptococcus equi subsp. zooepidemicus]|nr:FtsX-like permease family protein [Streptococcus equi subsp. zooepidemicus]